MSADQDRPGVIYGLIDGLTGELRYVGKTTRAPRLRLYKHKAQALGPVRMALYEWIREDMRRRKALELVVLEGPVPPAEVDDAERWHIAYFRAIGCDLLNRAPGGEGLIGGGCAFWSDERRRATAEAARRRMREDPSVREHLRAAARGTRIVDQFGNQYRSFSEAARALGTSPGHVRNTLVGITKHCRGRTFRLADEEDRQPA